MEKYEGYSIFPMTSRRRVVALGYPQGNGPLYYQQDNMSAIVEKVLDEETYFLIRVDEGFLNAVDREGEIQGFSDSPVWDGEMLGNHLYLFGGLIASGMGSNISRGRINVMNAKYVQSLMYQEFGILMKNRIPNVPENEVAPGYEGVIETQDQIDIRDSWIENERCKGQTYIDGLQLQKAVLVSQRAIKILNSKSALMNKNIRFIRCFFLHIRFHVNMKYVTRLLKKCIRQE